MKNIIALLFFTAAFVAVFYGGTWYVNEQSKQYEYEQIQNLNSRNSGLVSDSDTEISGIDPFGLFGSDEAVYEISLISEWSSRSHDEYYPSNAHLSQPIIWVGASNPVFSIGAQASDGIKEMAETGRTRILKSELDDLVDSGAIEQYDIFDRVDAPGSDTYTIRVTRDQSIVSIVSMIAPSPDWFIAIEGLDLLEDNRWKNNVRVNTIALDAGTENGSGFTIENQATSPQATISPLTDIPSVSLPPFAYIEFNKIGYSEDESE